MITTPSSEGVVSCAIFVLGLSKPYQQARNAVLSRIFDGFPRAAAANFAFFRLRLWIRTVFGSMTFRQPRLIADGGGKERRPEAAGHTNQSDAEDPPR